MKDHLWKPGESGNPAGRPKGSRNKRGQHFQDALAAFFEGKLEDLGNMYERADDHFKLQMWRHFLPYFAPRLAASDQEIKLASMTEEELDHIINALTETHEDAEDRND